MLVVSHYLHDVPFKKNYDYIFEFVKVMPKVLSVPFFLRHSIRQTSNDDVVVDCKDAADKKSMLQ